MRILNRPKNEFMKRNDIAIHLLEPSEFDLLYAFDVADRDMFETIVVYGMKQDELELMLFSCLHEDTLLNVVIESE